MNYGICSNGSRDTGYETAIKTAQILSGLGAVPVFETGMDETCPKLKEYRVLFSRTSRKQILKRSYPSAVTVRSCRR